MEREATSRSSSGSSSMSNYRGTDMEMGGEGLGLGFGGAKMQREGSTSAGLETTFGRSGVDRVGSTAETSSSDSGGGGADLGLGLELSGREIESRELPRLQIESFDGTTSTRRRSDSSSSQATLVYTPPDEDQIQNQPRESVTAQFLDGAYSSESNSRGSEDSLTSATVSGMDAEDDDEEAFHDSQESITGQILAHF